MSRTLQFFYFLCYGLAGLAIAYMAPKIFPEVPRTVAWLAGAVVFLAGALLHETASRCYHASLDRRRLALLHRAHLQATEELDRLAADVRRFTHGDAYYAETEPEREPAPRAQAGARPPIIPDDPSAVVERPLDPPPKAPPPRRPADRPTGTQETSALASEVKVLHALVQRLYARAVPERGKSAEPPAGGKKAVELGSLLEREILNSVRDSLRHGNLELHLQPIVTLPQRKHRHFDCTLRIASDRGDILSPAQYERVLRENKLAQAADDMLLFRTVQMIRKARATEAESCHFCRVPPACLADRGFFGDFLSYLREVNDVASFIAFELREADLIKLGDVAADALGSLAELGFLLCIDNLRSFDVDAAQLGEGGVRFVKMDAGLLMPAVSDETEGARLRLLKSGLDAAGIELVVTNIANEQLLVELLDFDIEFGQGPLFGEVRKIRDARVPPAEGRRERM